MCPHFVLYVLSVDGSEVFQVRCKGLSMEQYAQSLHIINYRVLNAVEVRLEIRAVGFDLQDYGVISLYIYVMCSADLSI